jgi:hypothetical protein
LRAGREQAMNNGMTGHPLLLGPAAFRALPSGALWWPARRLLCAGDLHLGKAGRLARRGGTLLPPYETEETLRRLAADIAAADPATVVCLGDSFDDGAAAGELSGPAQAALADMAAGRDWVWIAGNHDPVPAGPGGRHLPAFAAEGIVFRHIAEPGHAGPEVSAHFHPRVRLAGRSRPAFVTDGRRLILPAYGAYTGGLDACDPALLALLAPGARALLTGAPAAEVPLAALARLAPRSNSPVPARRVPR